MNGKEKAVPNSARELVCAKGDAGPHPFRPGEDVDMIREGRRPDPRWCNTCGERRAEPQSETVRDVADLRDRERVLLFGNPWEVRVGVLNSPTSRTLHRASTVLDEQFLRDAIAAGAVTRPPRPEPDQADVERLAGEVEFASIHCKTPQDVARYLLRSGIALRDPA